MPDPCDQAATVIERAAGGTAVTDDGGWRQVVDAKLRKRIQNRIAQRTYRK